MKILIVGASSFIGLRLYRFLLEETEGEVVGTYFEHQKDARFLHLDITAPAELEARIQATRPDTILWVAGTKNLKKCEEQPEYAWKINTTPVEDLLRILPRHDLNPHIVFISTDYVFDGARGRYADTDVPGPRTNYGKSNLQAERRLQQSPFDVSIVRTSAVMGRHGTFFDWVTQAMQQSQPIDLFDDVYFSPTPIGRLLKCLTTIVDHRMPGVFHVCGDQRLSRYEFAVALKQRNPRFIAPLVSTQADSSQPLFQKDLSLIPSAVCRQFETGSIFDELDGEM